MNEEYERFKRIVNNDLPVIPNVITEEWLKDALQNQIFHTWGFSFADLSQVKFDENISEDALKRVAFSTDTVFPKNSVLQINDKMFEIDPEIRLLHENGITGDGINVAVIDYGFKIIHNELKDNLVSYINFGKTQNHFHGTVVSSKFIGKKIGIAPGAKLYFYESRFVNQIEEVIKSLEDIYEKNKNGESIRIVSISASLHRQSEKFDEIVERLKTQNCYVIDSTLFGKDFTCINQDSITGEYYYSKWQEEHVDGFKKKIAIASGGKMIPLNNTKDGYVYCGESSYSWCIPMFSGLFALALQINPDLTLDEFVDIAKNNKTINDEGMTLFNIKGTFDYIMKMEQTKGFSR